MGWETGSWVRSSPSPWPPVSSGAVPGPRRQVEGTRLMGGGESWATDGVSWQKRHGSFGATAIDSN
jgi:hypothetical protein